MADGSQQKAFDLDAAMAKLAHADEGVRLGGIGELLGAKAAGQAIGAITACLHDKSERVQRAAVVALAEAGAPAVASLAKVVDSEQLVPIRILAASALARFGPIAASAVDALVRSLTTDNAELRFHAALALGKIGQPAIGALRKPLFSSDSQVRFAAIYALDHIGKAAKEALPDLKKIADGNPTLPLRLACAAAIVKISGDPGEGLGILIEALRNHEEAVRIDILEKLGGIRALARSAESAVAACLMDHSAKVRASAAFALARINAPEPDTIFALTRTLGDREAEVRISAAIALSAFGKSAAPALFALRQMQGDSEPRAIAIASAAIAHIEGKAIDPATRVCG